MKKSLLLVLLLFVSIVSGQEYSTFYGTIDANHNVDVNQNVNLTGTVNQNIRKTITTIDYGALAAANAQKETNRLMAIRYADSKAQTQAQEIALDPYAAYKYGAIIDLTFSRRESKKILKRGHDGNKARWTFIEPNSLLFSSTGFGKYRNTSADGLVLCEVEINRVYTYDYLCSKYPTIYKASEGTAIAQAENTKDIFKVGVLTKGYFTHKHDIGRATVYGHRGFRGTWIYETDYDYVIKDNYYSFSNGIFYQCGIRYSVAKSDGSFEDLEGRRHYLRKLGEEIIATAKFYYL